MQSDHTDPINLGQDRMISINELVDIVAGIAGKHVHRVHDLNAPQGVRGRNSDNTTLREVLGWEPSVSLEDGLSRTYQWIAGQLHDAGRLVGATVAGAAV
jgi:nucleoside-diphosphate-sugar epimerase